MAKQFNEGDEMTIFDGISGRRIGTGRVTKVGKAFLTVTTALYAQPVRYRLTGRLKGRRVIGGLAEYLNDYVEV